MVDWAFVRLIWGVAAAIGSRELMSCAGAARLRLGRRNRRTRKALYMVEDEPVGDDVGMGWLEVRMVGFW